MYWLPYHVQLLEGCIFTYYDMGSHSVYIITSSMGEYVGADAVDE